MTAMMMTATQFGIRT